MTEAFLRRPPSGRPVGGRIRGRALVLGAGLIGFALLDARASAKVTRLTREIQDAKHAVLSLEGELGYALRQKGAWEGRAAALEALETGSGFGAPGRGCLVEIQTTRE